jgi:DNA-binding transcriptional regulator YhcF (GntR family)
MDSQRNRRIYGSTSETVTRVMTSLEDQGFIEKKGRDFNIIDEDGILDTLHIT